MTSLASLLPQRLHLEKKPLIVTAGVHILLLLMLLLWRFSVPTPTINYPEMGMEVNLGTSTEGSGTDQPMDVEEPAASAATATRSRQREAANDAPEIERSTRHDAPVISETRPGRRQQEQTPRQERHPAPQTTTGASSAQPAQPQARYVYPGASGRGGNSAQGNISGTGEGITGRPGDQGVPGGTPGATNYSGTPGNGTGGMSHSLSNRNIVAFPPKEAAFREGGKVVIRVTVNRNGDIVNKIVKTSTNTELNSIALRKLQQVKFNKSETAPEEQFGLITFVFRPRQ